MTTQNEKPAWKSVDDILDFAIANEQDAVDFYTDLASRTKSAGLQRVFQDFVKEERGHKAKLERVKAGQMLRLKPEEIVDLKIGDYLADIEPTGDLDYQSALILAMKREKAAFKLYTDLAETINDAELSETFSVLAQEEAKHKLRFELEYDDQILIDN